MDDLFPIRDERDLTEEEMQEISHLGLTETIAPDILL
jgi:hypothetical protein